jgi:hypothetical protein
VVAGQKTDYHPDGINNLAQKYEKAKQFLEKNQKKSSSCQFFLFWLTFWLTNLLAN